MACDVAMLCDDASTFKLYSTRTQLKRKRFFRITTEHIVYYVDKVM